ncbi:MAG: ATP-binding protein [Coriobacteriales bacterium]|nr:ATP-binding protein [Coriobacteriales bacterium]
MQIIGRTEEQRVLTRCIESKNPEFVAVYGRRRVGKTYLVREFFENSFAFQLTGAASEGMGMQLDYFNKSFKRYGGSEQNPAQNWPDAFEMLKGLLENSKQRYKGKLVVFLDEIAWLGTRRSGFLSALEHFWNSWGSTRSDLILIVCGSASSWIVKKLFRNRGGLHNRVTKRLKLDPFTLAECEAFFTYKEINFSRRLIADAYLVFGGIPFYLDLFEPGKSVVQNVDAICFASNAPLAAEFGELYASLFEHEANYVEVVKALASRRSGLTRNELIEATGLSSGGSLTEVLEELELSGFIRRFDDFTGSTDRYLYQLMDFFSFFYLTFMAPARHQDSHFWANLNGRGKYHAWSGLSFELLCLTHIDQIKDGLGISGVSTSVSSWRNPSKDLRMQIDLVIDRRDGIINLCEDKYTLEPFEIDKRTAEKITARKDAFVVHTKTSKAVHNIMISAAGVKTNAHSHVVEKVLTLDDLFRQREG